MRVEASVSRDRWRIAQSAEASYWAGMRSHATEFSRILAEKVDAAAWAGPHLSDVPSGPFIEIGVGPLGVGLAHLLGNRSEHRPVIGVDPLARIPTEELDLPGPLVSLVRSCRDRTPIQVRAAGESIPLADELFALAACYNVLDHVRDPRAVMREILRVLVPGGVLILGCDVVSLLSIYKFELYVKRRYPTSVGVLAHPFRFRERSLHELVKDAGFDLLAQDGPLGRVETLVGRSRRRLLILRKPDGLLR